MGKRFCQRVLPPFHPPPLPGDPRIKVSNQYPGMLFAESDSDPDDRPSDAEDEFSDDEAAQFEFAPPVTPLETVMAAGRERDTKRLNYRLRTAPPIPAAMAVRQDGTTSQRQVYKAL